LHQAVSLAEGACKKEFSLFSTICHAAEAGDLRGRAGVDILTERQKSSQQYEAKVAS
jgi:hypothetical protein